MFLGDDFMENKKYITPDFITSKDLKNVRKILGLTQKDFAQFLNCSKSTVERWEMSDEPISGPVAVLVKMIERHPENVDEMIIPEKEYPIRMWYMHENNVCTIIDVDELRQLVRITNYAQNIMFRAFGIIEKPSFADYQEFLESRCFPRTRDKMKLILKDLDLPFYDPFLIIEKTEGRMAEDNFWIRIER